MNNRPEQGLDRTQSQLFEDLQHITRQFSPQSARARSDPEQNQRILHCVVIIPAIETFLCIDCPRAQEGLLCREIP